MSLDRSILHALTIRKHWEEENSKKVGKKNGSTRVWGGGSADQLAREKKGRRNLTSPFPPNFFFEPTWAKRSLPVFPSFLLSLREATWSTLHYLCSRLDFLKCQGSVDRLQRTFASSSWELLPKIFSLNLFLREKGKKSGCRRRGFHLLARKDKPPRAQFSATTTPSW